MTQHSLKEELQGFIESLGEPDVADVGGLHSEDSVGLASHVRAHDDTEEARDLMERQAGNVAMHCCGEKVSLGLEQSNLFCVGRDLNKIKDLLC